MKDVPSSPSSVAKFVRNAVAALITLLVLAVVAMIGLEGVDYIPDSAIVYVDQSNTYYSPPLLWEDRRSFYIAVPLEEVRRRGFPHISHEPLTDRDWAEVAEECEFVWVRNQDKIWTEFRPPDGICVSAVPKGIIKGKKEYSPDRNHVNAGGFFGESHSLIVHLLGLNESRWSADGTWKW